MQVQGMYGFAGIVVTLAHVAIGFLTLAVAFVAFQASQKQEALGPLRFVALGLGVLGLATVAGPVLGWLLGMVGSGFGGSAWMWIFLLKGLTGAAIDAIGLGAIGWGLWQLRSAR